MDATDRTMEAAIWRERDKIAKAREKQLVGAVAEIKRLKRENEQLRDALAPFSCLGRNELTTGDFNKARRVMASLRNDEE